jgi:hypothetical protein
MGDGDAGSDGGATTGVVTSAGPGTTVSTVTTATTLDGGTSEVTTFESSVSDATATSATSDDTMFIERPDGGGGIIDYCDPFAQDCPPGEKCMPWANDGGSQWNATKCSPIDPYMGGVSDPCWVEGSPVSGIDSCDATTMCFAVHSDTQLGTCVPFCTGSAANPYCDDPSTTCLVTNDGVIALCLPACDPLLQDCADAQGCYPGTGFNEFVCTPDFSRDGGSDGDTCGGPGPWFCDAGLACLAPELLADCMAGPPDVGCCSPFCDLTLPTEGQCNTMSGETCVPWIPEGVGPPQLDPTGVCRLPE